MPGGKTGGPGVPFRPQPAVIADAPPPRPDRAPASRSAQRHLPIPLPHAAAAEPGVAVERDELAVHVARAVLDGDRQAFSALVERDLPAVLRACHRVLGSAADAEDAAQEAFVTAFRSLPDWRGDGPFSAWVSRIAVRIAVRRARQRRPVDWIDVTALDGPDELLDGGGRRVARHFASAAADAAAREDPGRSVPAAEEAAAVRDALAALDEPYRETVALRYFGGLTVPEIAEVCGRPQGTVKTHLHRGLLRLRERLDAQGDGR